MNTTICLYHATACYTYCIVVIIIRLTLTPGFCTEGRIRTHDELSHTVLETVLFDHSSTSVFSEKICELRTEETSATVRGLHYHVGFYLLLRCTL